jgi:hypothetical protein
LPAYHPGVADPGILQGESGRGTSDRDDERRMARFKGYPRQLGQPENSDRRWKSDWRCTRSYKLPGWSSRLRDRVEADSGVQHDGLRWQLDPLHVSIGSDPAVPGERKAACSHPYCRL